MAFREMNGGGPILKWETPGQVVEGRVKAVKNGKVFSGKQSKLAVIATKDGDVTVGLTTVLEGVFAENNINAGSVVRITYTGKEKGKKSGVEFKAFKVEVDEESSTPAPAALKATDTYAGASDFDKLAKQLADKVGAEPAASMVKALKGLFKTDAEQLDGLKKALVQHGVGA